MGRFYRTSNSTPVDYMYKIDTPLMQTVLAANEGYISQELDQADKIGVLANYDHLAADNDAAKQITDSYTKQIDDLTSTITKDPANWRKNIQPLKDLSKDLQNNYTNGVISKHIFNYNRRKTDFDAIDKQVELYHKTGGQDKDGNAIGVSPERAAAYKSSYDSEFKGTNYDPKNPNAYNVYKGGTVMDDMNVKKIVEDGIDKIKADKTKEWHSNPSGNDWYFDKVTNQRVEITPERVLALARNNLENPKLLQYLQQDSKVGLVKGVFDETGNFIAPYDYTTPELSPEEQGFLKTQQALIDQTKNSKTKAFLQERLDSLNNGLKNRRNLQWNDGTDGRPNSYFTPILKGAIAKTAYSETESGNELSNNSKGSTMYREGQQNFRQNRQLAQALTIHNDTEKNKKDQFDKTLDEKIREFNISEEGKNSRAANKGVKGTTTTKGGKIVGQPKESTIAPIATNSFESQFTNDFNTNKTVPKLSVAGLSSDINRYNSAIKETDAKLKAIDNQLSNLHPNDFQYNSLQLQQNQLRAAKKSIQVELDDTRYYYRKTTEQVLANGDNTGTPLKPDEVAIYKEFDNDRDATKFKQHIEQLRKQYPNIQTKAISAGTGAPGFAGSIPSPQVQTELDKLNKYISTKKRVDNNKDTFLANARKTYIDSDAIVPNEQESNQLSDMILENHEGIKLFDKDGKVPNAKLGSWWTNNQNNRKNLDFTGGELSNYIAKNNVKMHVMKVAPTTAIGSGNAVVKVVFDDPNHNIPTDPFYIELNDNLQKDISTKYSTHKNPEIAKIGATMGNGLANSIRKQLAPLALNNSFKGDEGGGDEHHISLEVPDWKGNRGYLDVVKFTGGALHASVKDANGNVVDLPSTNGKPGFFSNTDDLINQYDTFLQKMKEIKDKQ